MIISSTSPDKAKYKQMLVDWVVAFCLLFFMHYIMAITMTVVDKLNDTLGNMAHVSDGIEIPSEYGAVKYNTIVTQDHDNQSVSQTSLGAIGDIFYTSDTGYNTVIDNIKMLPGLVTITEPDGTEKNVMLEEAITDGYVECTTSEDITTEERQSGNYVREYISTESGDSGPSKLTVTFKCTNSETASSDKVYVIEISSSESNSNGANATFRANEAEYSLSKYATWYAEKLEEKGYNFDMTDANQTETEGTQEISTTKRKDIKVANAATSDGSKVLYFTNYARLFLNARDDDKYLPMSTAYLIIYIALIAFTAVYTFRYIKRVIYMAFLTLMAPMVALTYPLDKVKDRKSTSMEYVV